MRAPASLVSKFAGARHFVLLSALVAANLLLGQSGSALGQNSARQASPPPTSGSGYVELNFWWPGKNVRWFNAPSNHQNHLHFCRDPDCQSDSSVFVATSKRSEAEKDPAYMQQLAKDLSAKPALIGYDSGKSLVSRYTTLKGYPAIYQEAEVSHGEKTLYSVLGVIFIKGSAIKLNAIARTRDLAKAHFNDFLGAMTVLKTH